MDATVLASAASGGIFGMIGAGVGAVSRHFEGRREAREQDKNRAHELELHKLNAEIGQTRQDAELEASLKERQVEVEEKRLELEGERSAASSRSLIASIKSDAAEVASGGIPGWARAVRTIFRPVITLTMLFMLVMVWRDLVQLAREGEAVIGALLSPESSAMLAEYIVSSIAFMAMTAVTWWFGERAFMPPKWKHR